MSRNAAIVTHARSVATSDPRSALDEQSCLPLSGPWDFVAYTSRHRRLVRTLNHECKQAPGTAVSDSLVHGNGRAHTSRRVPRDCALVMEVLSRANCCWLVGGHTIRSRCIGSTIAGERALSWGAAVGAVGSSLYKFLGFLARGRHSSVSVGVGGDCRAIFPVRCIKVTSSSESAGVTIIEYCRGRGRLAIDFHLDSSAWGRSKRSNN